VLDSLGVGDVRHTEGIGRILCCCARKKPLGSFLVRLSGWDLRGFDLRSNIS